MLLTRIRVFSVVAAVAALFGGLRLAVAAVAVAVEVEEAVQPVAVPLERDIEFQEVVVGPGGVVVTGDSGMVAEQDGRLIYQNTLGISAINFPTNQPVSDDIATTARDGCRLTSFKFKVLGKVVPTGLSGPYTVKYALYTNCPLAVGSGPTAHLRELAKIPGTTGEITFGDEGPRTIKHVVDSHNPVTIPTNVYLGLQFNRGNCGTIVGAPAMVGFSGDSWDFPGFPCNGFLGGFPELPHASFWLEMYGDPACPVSFPGYKCARASGSPALLGAGVQGVDDIKLQVEDCKMVGYEVAVRGVGFYNFDLRRQCDGQIFPGTDRTFQVNVGTTPLLQLARFSFNPPIPLLDDDLFLGFKSSSNSAGAVVAGISAVIGESSQDYFAIGFDGCQPVMPASGVHGAIHMGITCAGAPPTGACCDMGLLECKGGTDDGKRCPCDRVCVGGWDGSCCNSDSDCVRSGYPPGTCVAWCASPGSCEAVCRELQKMNCPWPPPLSGAKPAWIEGGVCSPDPFELPCGLAACCKPDDMCENLTQNACKSLVTPGEPILWQQGAYCGQSGQSCPYYACLQNRAECTSVHDEPGCYGGSCCDLVCSNDIWCCHVEWDRECVRQADELCSFSPSHDLCWHSSPIRSALPVGADSLAFISNSQSSGEFPETSFCCSPESTGSGPLWFKFIATHDSIQINTCESDPEGDSLINLFAVGDSTSGQTECQTLSLIGCGDDGCSSSGRHSNLCVSGLTPGATYYIMLASKTPEDKGIHQIQFKSPGDCSDWWVGGDCNKNGRTDGCDLVDGASADCDENSVPDECEEGTTASGMEANSCVRISQELESAESSYGFGKSLSSDGEWLFVGDPAEWRDGQVSVGAVHVYRRTGNAWVQAQTLGIPCPNGYCQFGISVAVSGNWAFALGYDYIVDVGFIGRVHTYRLIDDNWISMGDLGLPPLEFFNWRSIVLDGDMAALAGASHLGTGFECSAGMVVFMFRNVEGVWQYESRIPAAGSFGECNFGMDLEGRNVAIASSEDRIPNQSVNPEDSVQIFEHAGSSWRLSARFAFPDYTLSGPVTVHGNMVAATGIEASDSNQYLSAGFVYSRSADGWKRETIIQSPGFAYYYLAHAIDFCHGGLVGMVVTDSNNFCTRAHFYQRSINGDWTDVCDVQLPNCLVSGQTIAISCTKDNAALGVSAIDESSVFAFSLPSVDCDGNGAVDTCDFANAVAEDCNSNHTLDQCDIRLPNDADDSGHVDIQDFGQMQNCFGGQGIGLKPCCGAFDSESGDGDADLVDFAGFVGVMGGP